jgi:uncharacterized membrane protein
MEDSGVKEHRENTDQPGERELRILEKIRRGELVTRNVNDEHEKRLTLGDRVADWVASVIGSWRFIIIMSAILIVWITLNVVGWVQGWDPYPFILLNLVLSFQAAYAAPVIMMSQNRRDAKDRLHAAQDYAINCKAELEIADIRKNIEEIQDLQRRQLALVERLMPLTDEQNH